MRTSTRRTGVAIQASCPFPRSATPSPRTGHTRRAVDDGGAPRESEVKGQCEIPFSISFSFGLTMGTIQQEAGSSPRFPTYRRTSGAIFVG